MEGDLPARAVLVEQIADDARRRWRGHLLDRVLPADVQKWAARAGGELRQRASKSFSVAHSDCGEH